MHHVILEIESSTLRPEKLQLQAANLRNLLQTGGIQVKAADTKPPAVPAGSEGKAEPISLTALAVIGAASALVALINAIRAVQPAGKDTEISYTLRADDGSDRLNFTARGLTRDQATFALETWTRMIEGIGPRPIMPNKST